MSVQKPRITIVGLGLIGASIGMALRNSETASMVIGHDKNSAASNKAKKLGAVDKTEWMLIPACEKSDLVILAIPVGAIKDTLQAIGPYLRAGCVVLDTASLKAPVLEWADELLSDQVHFVGGDPILAGTVAGQGGLEAARVDLFQNGLFCVMPSKRAGSDAIKMVTDLVSILGAKPLFHDPVEHDGLTAAVDQLPRVLALALLETTVSQPAWRELRKLAGPAFETGTHWAQPDPATVGQLCMLNRENLVRWIDAFSDSLTSIREALTEGQAEPLAKRFESALKQRSEWLQSRSEGIWDEGLRTEIPKQSLLQPLLGGLASRKSRKTP